MNPKLGYYSVDGVIFESKIKAMIHANPINAEVRWHFNDDEFSKYNWSIEPTQTLDELYDIRSKQIREEYDYVILSYSGGADSNNILESFIRQGLHIDEIVTNWALDITDKYLVSSKYETSSWNNNSEFKLHTVGRLDYIKSKCPLTKITVNDTSKSLVSGLLTKDDASWVESKNGVLNVTGITNYNLVYFDSIRKTFDKGKRIAFVVGTDKPQVTASEDKVYLRFSDFAANMVSSDEHLSEYPNATTIFYYWDSDACDILCKQAHTILHHLKTSTKLRDMWTNPTPSTRRSYHEKLMKHMIYPSTWSDKYWQVSKSTMDWDSELDYWFTRGWRGTKEHDIWVNGIKSIIPRISNFIVKSNGLIRGTKPYFSNFYFIGNL